jgi:hypothetical protein
MERLNQSMIGFWEDDHVQVGPGVLDVSQY